MSDRTVDALGRPRSVDELARHIRRRVLELSYAANVGHIGSCLCIADIVAAILAAPSFNWSSSSEDRDRLVLSKGHAGLALYCGLEATGAISSTALETFGSEGAEFGVHPEVRSPGIDFATGSLGQGLGMATGAAIAARMQQSSRRTIAVLSDAECNAGATWEAAAFAGHHRLGNLIAIVDVNGQQALGPTAAIIDQEPFAERWRAFRWEVREVNGHDLGELTDAIERASDQPIAIVARTTFGAGVSFMEGRLEWHYLPMTREQFDLAMREQDHTDAR